MRLWKFILSVLIYILINYYLSFANILILSKPRYDSLYNDEVIDATLKDIDFVLQNIDQFGDLSKALDVSKIIIMSHSIDGNIAHIKGFFDKRILAVVDIDIKITEHKIFGHVSVLPNLDAKSVLFIRGMMQYQDDVGDQLTKILNSTNIFLLKSLIRKQKLRSLLSNYKVFSF